MWPAFLFLFAAASLWPFQPAIAQTPTAARSANVLHQLNESIEALVQRVSPCVVQIQVTGFGTAEENDRGQAELLVGRRRAIGSGVIVDPEGYIVTNAHVVNGAQNIEVIVPPRMASSGLLDPSQGPQGKSYQARVVGTARDLDLAVIKIEARALPALALHDSGTPARQGEMVFAFGSPEGLRNTVTMGVVSAVARQPDPDSPLVYVQTDTPINPGNSGGALVNADGELVGINTFILSSSGGNQGLGFAIPSGVVAAAYPQLLKYGHVHQPAIGALVQTITPELAAGLHLQRDFGVIVSDVVTGGPADTAGLKIQDIILSVDGVGRRKPAAVCANHLYAQIRRTCAVGGPARSGARDAGSAAGRAAAQRRQLRGYGRPGKESGPAAEYSWRRTYRGTCSGVARSADSHGSDRGRQNFGNAHGRNSAANRGRNPRHQRNVGDHPGRTARRTGKNKTRRGGGFADRAARANFLRVVYAVITQTSLES